MTQQATATEPIKKRKNIAGLIEMIKENKPSFVMIGTDKYEPSEAVYCLGLIEPYHIVLVWQIDNVIYVV